MGTVSSGGSPGAGSRGPGSSKTFRGFVSAPPQKRKICFRFNCRSTSGPSSGKTGHNVTEGCGIRPSARSCCESPRVRSCADAVKWAGTDAPAPVRGDRGGRGG
ncbi:hypothetical protein SFR_0589 [Streptomyces sp. FR-008]|nr:hypothetical protein SFR_0589 [Streptomyces sp. FR-008]